MTPRGGRLLHTSFNFANRRFLRAKAPGRLVILAGGSETFLRWMNLAFRHCDRLLRTRLSVYGWALYFGGALQVETQAWRNVCVGCGAADPATSLSPTGYFPRRYRCAGCGSLNYYVDD